MKKLIIILLVFLTACSANTNIAQYSKEKTYLGYITDSNNDMVLLLNTEVYLTTVNKELKETLVNETTAEIANYHKLLDSHHKYLDENGKEIVNIAVLNDSIGEGPVNVDPIIIEVLKEAITLSELTYGYFNFTLGKLSNLYNNKLLPYDTINKDPEEKEIQNCLKGIISPDKMNKYIIIDEENNTVELIKNDYPYILDLGAFSKGYILNQVYKKLIKYDTSFLLNAGASSIVSYTNNSENISWTIAIKNPEINDNDLLTFSLNNGAISTSGDYELYYYLEDGTKRHHILNPYTGYSENFLESNTLISDNAGIIDALSTALFNIEQQNDSINAIKNVENYYNTDISFLAVQKGLNIFMDKKFSESIINGISTQNSYTSTIIEE